MIALHHRPWAEGRVWGKTRDFSRADLLEHSLTLEGKDWLMPHLKTDYPWELDGYLRQGESIRQRVLADWVAVRVDEESRLATAWSMTMVFPLLDTRLISTLLQQDPLLFGEGQRRGRLLHRRAFAHFLPPELRTNPSKARAAGKDELQQFRSHIGAQHLQAIEALMDESPSWHPALGRWWHLDVIRQGAEALLEHRSAPLEAIIGTHDALNTMARLSHWWCALDG